MSTEIESATACPDKTTMTSRIPYSAKGKGISYYQKESSKSYHKYPPRYEQERGDSYQSPRTRKETTQDFSAPPLKRIRAPDVDTSDLIEENALTLMGRLTNPSAQRLWSLIPYLSNRWNLRGKAIGSDLGNGCFQFRFDFEEDLTKVLENRPYHFDQWMVILQKWEPVISASFPSQIPFWVELQGLPMHFWKQQMIYRIGEELGTILDHEITPAAAKVKVEINGLAPLTKQTVVEFPDGSEALVTLEYKNLKKHCFHCQRLSHEIANCPGLEKGKSDAKPPPAQVIGKETPKRNDSAYNREQSRALPKESYSRNSRPSISKGNYTPSGRQFNGREAMTNTSSGSRTYGYRHSNARRSPPRPLNYSSKVPARSTDRPYHSNSRPNFQWRERTSSPAAGPGSSETSRTRRPPLERGSTAGESSPTPRPVPTTEEIMGELREVTVQYTNCADPTESMARKQRVLQGEARGLMAETAAQILAAAVNIAPSSPDLPPHPSTLTATGTITMKKKRGRPPLNKTVNKSPLNLKGAKSSKRNKELIQNSPRRRSTGGKSTNAEEPNPPVPQRKSAKQRLTMPNEEAGPSTTREPPQPLQWMDYSANKLVSPHSPGGGGLAILWKDHIELETLEACPNFIDTHIKAEGKSFFATFVYGEPDKSKRKSIWEQLSTIGQARSDPWYLTGDFNDIIDSSEKQGGPNRPEGSFIDFRTFMSECDLFDLRHSGNFLSWRGQRHDHLVHCRLDRAMSNSSWAEVYPSGRCEYLRFEGSDHRPLLTCFDLQKKKRKGLFRYDRRLRNNKEVSQLIRNQWKPDEDEDVEKKLSRCRTAIITWTREKHLNSQKRVEEARTKLEIEMSSTSSNTLRIAAINEELRLAYKDEEDFWKQRSRQLWLTLGDKNTGYFHAITKGRKAVNKFSILENEAGQVFYEEEKILGVITEYYQTLFHLEEGERESIIHEALSPCISAETNDELTAIPLPEEIRGACFSIHADKAPGPDGFSASFFQSHWPTVGPQIILEIQNFFSSGILPRNINLTHVRLIPKITSPKKMSDYRPIALCTVYYKIISKILTKRLQPVLHSLVAENQSAFVPQRAISDNVLITHEVLHYLHASTAKKRCYMAVKTDMSKAYDRIEWEFIELVLQRMGFHHIWINWMMQCITTVNYSYLLNGSAQGSVSPQRGIRQGDPLSPYIFILCSEVLTGLCKKAERENRLTGIKVGKLSPRISHLLFADDTMFFCKSDNANCSTLLEILKNYELASGQMINAQKSAVTFSTKTPADTRERVKTQLGIQKEGGLGKYLGLPELFGRKKKDLFTIIVDRIRQRARSWSSRFLSTAGKTIMLKSVLAAMPSYSMSCFKLPNSLYKRIQSVLTRFWWDSSMEKKKMCWISWKKLTKAKGNGGLGFRDLQSFNDALLTKVSWRILANPSCLLAKILLGKYCHTTPFLDSVAPTSTSHGWRGICIGKELLKSQLGKVIGNGKDTLIWKDPWISLTSPVTPMGPATSDSQNLTVDQLICPVTGEWNRDKIQQLLPEYEHQILEIKMSKLGAKDVFAWLPTKSGTYSAKSGYYESLSTSAEESENLDLNKDFKWSKNIWHIKSSPKTKFFVWKVMRGAIPVGENLRSRGLEVEAKCPFCDEIESTLHLFFKCRFASQIWERAPFKTPVCSSNLTSFRSGLEGVQNLVCLPPSGLGEGPLHTWILWKIWLARNQQIFNKCHDSPQETLSQAIKLAREWQEAQRDTGIQTPNRAPPIHQLPGSDVILCQSDAAWDESSKQAGLGWIFSNRSLDLSRSDSKAADHIRSPLLAEGLALLEALNQAHNLGFTKLSVASDSKQLIEAIKSESHQKELHGILHDILTISSTFVEICFRFIPREKNREADALAKHALRNSFICTR
ncbi:Reverse transcriptase zinc-binding domain [Arabidopsis thaliana x Arabidopsis arenosa]|uniref:Reverse transcriptase zinc-binding domain n=1 Tax=Arabidopsis thaliana x Arabidopsis arenosa TaxID=1240361 RepID=A0A8T1ZJ54_9BRAS|nr:Reverse transcriptase zinc-binding domain [Arabidopsis thaliana x Arabidopsis arenosa]